jgi:environmental stress-induced protein Ves
MKRFTKDNFKAMPWKNGGGQTTELFRFPKNDEFLLRISRADVVQDGEFSFLPGMDRHLYLLKGDGCQLIFTETYLQKILTPQTPLLFFPGEAAIFCRLLNGPLQDFNVMIDRKWGEASVGVIKDSPEEIELQCTSDWLFAYDPSNEELLQLESGDSVNLFSTHLIVIEVKKKAG